jgi:hypothetical protein
MDYYFKKEYGYFTSPYITDEDETRIIELKQLNHTIIDILKNEHEDISMDKLSDKVELKISYETFKALANTIATKPIKRTVDANKSRGVDTTPVVNLKNIFAKYRKESE